MHNMVYNRNPVDENCRCFGKLASFERSESERVVTERESLGRQRRGLSKGERERVSTKRRNK